MSVKIVVAFALMLLVVATPVAAQQSISDRDLSNLPHSGGLSYEDRKRYDELRAEEGKSQAADQALGEKLLRLPPLPVDRNVLLGNWRMEDGGQGQKIVTSLLLPGAAGSDAMLREVWGMLESNPAKLVCVGRFGNGITFEPSTYSISALDGSAYAGSVKYRSGQGKVIVAIPGNQKPMAFEVVDSNRIVFEGSCPLVRVGAPAASAAASAPGNARAGAASSSVPRAAVPGSATPALSPSPPPARAQGIASLAVGPDAGGYSCPDGRQILVSHCYDESAQASCQVIHLHKKNNGLNPETAATRDELLVSLGDCTLKPLEFGPSGISLVQ
jgi:hypothetical protein